MITTLLLATVMASGQVSTDPAPMLRPERLYAGAHRPVQVTIDDRLGSARPRLVLMTGSGEFLAESEPLPTGTWDLDSVLPQAIDQRSTCYLQLMDGDLPLGSAVVMQPLLSRMVPVTEVATRSDGSPYLRIGGFISEGDDADRIRRDIDGQEDPPNSDFAPQPLVFSGFRTYLERDVLIETDHGDIRIALTPEHAPNAAWNFRHLAEGGFYDGIVFHRVVPLDRQGRPFVVQAGDPTDTGSGGPGYWLPIEPSSLEHDFGVISMARDVQPDSAGSQFFIGLSREGTARLDGQYCAFGYAVHGAATILEIADVELADLARGRPVQPPVIERMTLIAAPPRTLSQGRPDSRVTEADIATEQPETPGRIPR